MKLSLSSLEAKVARETYLKRRGHEEDYQRVMFFGGFGGVLRSDHVHSIGGVTSNITHFSREGAFPGGTVDIHIHPLPHSPASSGDGPICRDKLAPTGRNIYRSEKWRKTLRLTPRQEKRRSKESSSRMLKAVVESVKHHFSPTALPQSPQYIQDSGEGKHLKYLKDRRLAMFEVTVDYSRTVKDMFVHGKHHWSNPPPRVRAVWAYNLPMKMKRTGVATIRIKLVTFNHLISGRDAMVELNKMSRRPVDLHELLALGRTHPRLLRDEPIIALDSIWQSMNGHRWFPYFCGYGSRDLAFHYLPDALSSRYRFAAVCQ